MGVLTWKWSTQSTIYTPSELYFGVIELVTSGSVVFDKIQIDFSLVLLVFGWDSEVEAH